MISRSSPDKAFTVSNLNRLARNILEDELGNVWVKGDISNMLRASSGHWYFTLKDSGAQVKAAMFRGNNRLIKQPPKDGDEVIVRGRISLYEPRGDYQLIVEHMQGAGEGLLKQKFEQLKAQLHSEGLFDPQHKQSLPDNIHRVGVITSPDGAALHDILTVLKRRSPTTEVVIYPTQVQGTPATLQIAEAIVMANLRNEVDVLIVGRGGGSLEDLWCFNEEPVARAIFASHIPVISAVGHETDFSIADMVADLRAPTPSAAAELVSADRREHLRQLTALRQQLLARLQSHLRTAHQHIDLAQARLARLHPEYRLQQQAQRIDNLQVRLNGSIHSVLQTAESRLQRSYARLQQQSPVHAVKQASQQQRMLQKALNAAMLARIQQAGVHLSEQAHLLNTLSPLSTLERGFSVPFQPDGQLIRSVHQVKAGDNMINRLVDGEIISQVIEVQTN